jgi:uncharacterized protein YoxC
MKTAPSDARAGGYVWWSMGPVDRKVNECRSFSPIRLTSSRALCHTLRPMSLWAQAAIVVCAIIVTVAVVITLSSIRRAAGRAETVLQLVEREIRPLASQVEALAAEVRTLSHAAHRELERVSGVVRRVEDISVKTARVVGVVNRLASFRGVTGVGSGLKRAVGVFFSRLRV